MAQLDSFLNSVDHVEIERLSRSASFLGPIQNGNLADGRRESFDKPFERKRPVQPDFQQANSFASLVQVFHRLLGGLCTGAHHDDNALSIGGSHIVEEVIRAAHDLGKLVYYRLHPIRACLVVRIARFTRLKVDVGILRGTAQHRMVWRKRTLPMLEDTLQADEGAHVVFGEHFDLVDLMRSAEAVKEVQERDTGFESTCMRDKR